MMRPHSALNFPGAWTDGPRVLKQDRCQSVWKAEALADPGCDVRVLHAHRGSGPETIQLDAFIARCEPYFGWGGSSIDQAFQPRLPDGVTRC